MSRLRGILLLLIALVLAGCRDTRAKVVFTNETDCGGPIAVRLTNTTNDQVISERVPQGEQLEIVVEADIWYDYVVDFTAAGIREDGLRCTLLDRGRLRVPSGSTQYFPLRSDAVPTATP